MTLSPVALPANQPRDRFYAGGERIARFRGVGSAAPHTPEDWVGSTTTLFGDAQIGLTPWDGGSLRDAVEADPLAWLGERHVARYGVDTMLLVKLLDAGQRLPVHAHPDDAFAQRTLGRAHGKSEAWYILEPGEVFLGLRRDVDERELAALVSAQRVDELRDLLHTRRVDAGDTVFVPAGMLHAIGAGILLVEVQQPEDLSILLEWRDFDIDGAAAGHLGLGFEVALTAVTMSQTSPAAIDALISRDHARSSALVGEADEFFVIERFAAGEAPLDAGFAVVVVLDGEGELHTEATSLPLSRGATVLLPHAAGAVRISGDVHGVVCRPPSP
ncbi:class I mannose-6-phosphate isomerase [Microbacterium sp.]|uniref:class I mannose-6-phosphate isomerase n=1 Tax=Microbacterium sp. TaxID=51671 RepID=UPI0039E6206A